MIEIQGFFKRTVSNRRIVTANSVAGEAAIGGQDFSANRKQNAYDEKAADQAVLAVMKLQLAKLSVRSGPERIIKVIANSKIAEFPDSHERNISQWKFKRQSASCGS
ncbi:hypothetical protein [uncultured Bradyrhizobium sp.]|uniref:hypothetical protein n=1 Tax=uncultured Bradyrhizobium sp. TaxID=199684 RepID=UPI0035CAE7A9